MKTKLLTLAVITAVVFNIAQARAETCESGKLVTGNNGHAYCQSKYQMNWWSAYAWCEAQGRHLASMYELCPDWDGSKGGDKCANTKDGFDGLGWTKTAFQQNYAFTVYPSGTVDADGRTYGRFAFCY